MWDVADPSLRRLAAGGPVATTPDAEQQALIRAASDDAYLFHLPGKPRVAVDADDEAE
jgi:hypothetical protein